MQALEAVGVVRSGEGRVKKKKEIKKERAIEKERIRRNKERNP